MPTEFINDMSAAGVIGIFALLVIREILAWRKGRDGAAPARQTWLEGKIDKLQEEHEAQRRELHDLWVWHSPDQGGEQTWKNTTMLSVVEKVGQAIDNNTKVIDRLLPLLDKLERKP